MKARQLRTIIISKPDPVDVQAALDKLRGGKALTAGESGVTDYAPLQNVDLAGAAPPPPIFDGVNYTVFLFVLSG